MLFNIFHILLFSIFHYDLLLLNLPYLVIVLYFILFYFGYLNYNNIDSICDCWIN